MRNVRIPPLSPTSTKITRCVAVFSSELPAGYPPNPLQQEEEEEEDRLLLRLPLFRLCGVVFVQIYMKQHEGDNIQMIENGRLCRQYHKCTQTRILVLFNAMMYYIKLKFQS